MNGNSEVGANEFIALGTFEPGAYTVHVRDWQLVSLRLAVAEPAMPEVLGIQLRTTTPDGENELRCRAARAAGVVAVGGHYLGSGVVEERRLASQLARFTFLDGKGASETLSREGLSTGLALSTALSECFRSDPDRAAVA